MDLKKTGAFIAQRRREKELTQSQLAAHLAVTDKAVSRWETGRGFPDPSTLPALAEALGVSVTELVNGEAAAVEETRESSEEAVLSALRYAGGLRRQTIGAVLLAVGVLCLFYGLVAVGVSTPAFYLLGALLLAAGIVLLRRVKRPARTFGVLSTRTARILSIVFLFIAFVLEWLPNGVQMRWAAPPGEPPHFSYCAYFSLLPFGYGNIFPLLTAVGTSVLLAGALAALMRRRPIGRWFFVVGTLTLILSLAPALLLGALMPTGWGISLSLLASLAFHALGARDAASVK